MAIILVVEDDPDLLALTRLRLTKGGHNVVPCSNGQTSLDVARAIRPDLIITDWVMPGLTGIDLCKHIRNDQDLAATPVLLLTARSRHTDRDAAVAAGVNVYLTKPVSTALLLAKVDQLTANSVRRPQ